MIKIRLKRYTSGNEEWLIPADSQSRTLLEHLHSSAVQECDLPRIITLVEAHHWTIEIERLELSGGSSPVA